MKVKRHTITTALRAVADQLARDAYTSEDRAKCAAEARLLADQVDRDTLIELED
jgi:hypothetical protein